MNYRLPIDFKSGMYVPECMLGRVVTARDARRLCSSPHADNGPEWIEWWILNCCWQTFRSLRPRR